MWGLVQGVQSGLVGVRDYLLGGYQRADNPQVAVGKVEPVSYAGKELHKMSICWDSVKNNTDLSGAKISHSDWVLLSKQGRINGLNSVLHFNLSPKSEERSWVILKDIKLMPKGEFPDAPVYERALVFNGSR